MSSETLILCMTAVSIGALHTILGPDHYVPFVAMSRADGWSGRKTLGVTIACGLGHVAGSVAIGGCGLMLGTAVMQLEWLESLRGDLAAWLLIGFGLASLAWGLKRGGCEVHAADGGVAASHAVSAWTPWLAFLVFVFGPCEPLIPLLMVPAARADAGAVAAVVAAFAVATVGTMALAVMAMRYGLSCVPLPSLGRFSHALAGLAILVCGVLVKVGL
jgi:nickel/cobalt exporter